MLLNPLASASAVVLCLATTASAQQQVQKVRVLGPVKDAGIYHVVSGTWTRNSGSTANLGPDIIYRNDHPTGYFGTGWEGAQGVDEGILPGPGNPFLGPQDAYLINGLSFSYCARGNVGGIDWDLELYDSYFPCDDPDFPANCIHSVWTLSLPGLPTNPVVGVQSCWLITLDLTGGAEACMEADGGPCAPGYQGGGLGLDHFGFGQTWLNGGQLAGPILAGNPAWAPPGDGTCYQPNMTCPAGATGLGFQDFFAIGTPLNGCFFFGGCLNNKGCGKPSNSVCASMDQVLFADCTQTCTPQPCDTISCDETLDPNNTADIDVDDCVASSDSQLIVSLSNAPADRFSYLLLSVNSGAVQNPPGALGTLCVSGQIARYAKDIFKTDMGGAGSMDLMNAITGGGGGNVPVIGGNIVGGTWNAQYWFRVSAGVSGFSSLVNFGPVL